MGKIREKNNCTGEEKSGIPVKGNNAERELFRIREKYAKILEGIEEGYFEVDLAGNMRFCNDSLCVILGYSKEEFLAMSNKQFTDEVNAKRTFVKFNEVFTTGIPIKTFEWEAIRKDGSAAHLSTSVSLIHDENNKPEGFRGIVRDISDKKKAEREKSRLEEQLRQSQKMEAIGTLAGGIAHDFNNVLAAIMGYSELAAFEIDNKEKVRDCLAQVKSASLRAKEMVKQILTYSRQTAIEKKPVKLAEVIKTSISLLQSSLPSTVRINTAIKTNADVIVADATQIEQVILNLGTNAFHAMGIKGGIIDIVLETIEKNERENYDLCLSFRDSGQGIPPHILDRIFDPYYTTKAKNKGTGLGLATVHGIIAAHEAAIAVESTVGEGTVFKIYFSSVALELKKDVVAKTIVPGSGRVLFVDDEEMLTAVGRQMLERFGYEVEAYSSPIAAFEKFKEDPMYFDVVITDMTMPGMTGDVLTEKIKCIRQGIPVIICTGYSDALSREHAMAVGANELLFKPMEITSLTNAVKAVLPGAIPRQEKAVYDA
jgi:PAS domain S-box-containing protein